MTSDQLAVTDVADRQQHLDVVGVVADKRQPAQLGHLDQFAVLGEHQSSDALGVGARVRQVPALAQRQPNNVLAEVGDSVGRRTAFVGVEQVRSQQLSREPL